MGGTGDADSQHLVALEDLGGVAEVAEALGVSRQAVVNWAAGRARTGFPAPLIRLRATPVYSLAQIRAWYAESR